VAPRTNPIRNASPPPNYTGAPFLSDPTGTETEVYDLNLATGARSLSVRFSPGEKAGIRSKEILFTPDGFRFAYVVGRINSKLFVADGLR